MKISPIKGASGPKLHKPNLDNSVGMDSFIGSKTGKRGKVVTSRNHIPEYHRKTANKYIDKIAEEGGGGLGATIAGTAVTAAAGAGAHKFVSGKTSTGKTRGAVAKDTYQRTVKNTTPKGAKPTIKAKAGGVKAGGGALVRMAKTLVTKGKG